MPHPRLSWIPPFDQGMYLIVVVSDGRKVWDSGKVRSSQSLHIAYGAGAASSKAAKALEPGRFYKWRVRVWATDGRASPWSDWATWSMAPAWTAGKWIGEPVSAPWLDTEPQPSPFLRKSFSVKGRIRRATVYASAMGVYELRLNGARVGDQLLAPEWTDYHKRIQYQAHDVTSLLRQDESVIGGVLAQGWYAGRIGLSQLGDGAPVRGMYGRHLRLFVNLVIEHEDGTQQVVASDDTWRYSTDGPIRAADLLDGETYDARRELPGWDAPGFDDTAWKPVETCLGPQLVPQPNEPIRITRTLAPISVSQPRPGAYIFDLGQNMVGWVRMKLRGLAGQEIRFRHGEALNPDGSLYRENLRIPPITPFGAPQEDRYICRGAVEEVFEPHFTYHGFRYVEVTGLNYPPAVEDLAGCVFHSDAAEVGRFECSSPLLNKIMSAIQWTQRGNMHSVPTDCPQRDERCGWMGDIQVFSQTAVFNMGMGAFFTKWLGDVRDAQTGDGRFPDIAPHPFNPNQRLSANPGWADAGVIVPWRAYVNYGDRRLLEGNYDAAKRWIDFVRRHNPDLVWRNKLGTGFTYGDWLNSDTFEKLADFPRGKGQVPNDVYATAFFAYSTQLLARTAAAISHKDEAGEYSRLAAAIRRAFVREFVSPDAKIKGDTQAGYALALHFDLLPVKLRRRAAQRLVAALKSFGGHLSTGIQSTVRAMMELTRWGYADLAYDLINKTTIPSWGYMIEQGGTTIWERWDGYAKDRGLQNPTMNSFNHYAIGAVGEWMWRVIVGLNPDEDAPGWKHFFVRPIPPAPGKAARDGGLTWVRGEYKSIRGPIMVEWRTGNRKFTLDLTVPPNTTATVQLPGRKKAFRVGSGNHCWG